MGDANSIQLYTMVGVERQEGPHMTEVIRESLWKKRYFMSLEKRAGFY